MDFTAFSLAETLEAADLTTLMSLAVFFSFGASLGAESLPDLADSAALTVFPTIPFRVCHSIYIRV